MRRILISSVCAAALALAPTLAFAQSAPHWRYLYTPSPGEWDQWWGVKADLSGLIAEAARARAAEAAAQSTANTAVQKGYVGAEPVTANGMAQSVAGWVGQNANTAAAAQATANGALPHVANNAALQAYAGPASTVRRDGYSAAGDGGAVTYTLSSSACSVADNGAQVTAASGGCWIGDLRGGPLNPRVWGAQGNGSADDTAALQATVSYAASVGGQRIALGRGYYCVKTGPLNVVQQGQMIAGEDRYGGSVLDACGADVGVVAMQGTDDMLEDVQVVGSQNPATNKPAVALNTGCAECTLFNVYVKGGSNAVYVNGYEAYILYSRLEFSYGYALVYWSNAGGYMTRDKMDMYYPAGTPSRFISINPWAAGTAYTKTQSLVTSNGFIFQAMGSGTSGSTAPAPAPYGTDVPDGGVTWRIVSRSTYYGIQFDTGSGANAYVSDSDFSSSFTWAIAMTNGYGGRAPFYLTLDKNTVASGMYGGILANAGSKVQITNTAFGGCIVAGCTGVQFGGNFVGDAIVQGNLFDGYAADVYLGAGSHFTLSNNIGGGGGAGLSVSASVKHWKSVGDTWGGSALYGANNTGIYIAPGSDYYVIQGDDNSEATTPINEATPGAHRSVGGNL